MRCPVLSARLVFVGEESAVRVPATQAMQGTLYNSSRHAAGANQADGDPAESDGDGRTGRAPFRISRTALPALVVPQGLRPFVARAAEDVAVHRLGGRHAYLLRALGG